jgi:CRISPR-associated protein Cas2
MAKNKIAFHIISYDIADPKRLARIHRYLKKKAEPIQYSVFLFQGTHQQLRIIYEDIADLIDENEDDVRFYTLPQKQQIVTMGRQGLGNGIQIINQEISDYLRLL